MCHMASRLAVSGSQGTRRRSLARRAARRYIAIPRAARWRLSTSPHLLHIRWRQTCRRPPRSGPNGHRLRASRPLRIERTGERWPLPGEPRRSPPSRRADPRPHGSSRTRSSHSLGARARDTKKAGAARPPPRRCESAVHRSAAPCSPTGFPRSTIGARRLSFRVRNGSGRAPPAMAADRWAALRPHCLLLYFIYI